ncbi:MAG: DUF423 domain-containing protein [Bdellovibrionia bacterium]
MNQIWIGLGAIFAFLSVGCGAFGAHGLESKLEPRMLAVWETAARYQMYHALALIGLGLWVGQRLQQTGSESIPASVNVTGWAFTIGIVLFSGSLYALALSGIKVLGAITPLGGMAFLIGWIAFAVAAFKS